jgi:hypothetical protein
VELALLFTRQVLPKVTARLMAVVLLPVFVGGLLLRYQLDWSWPWVLAITLVLSWFLELPFVVFAGRALFDQSVSAKVVLVESLGRLPSYFLVTLFEVGVIAVLLPTAVGPLFAMASYCFASEAVTLERATASGALKRAQSLRRGRSGTGVQTVFLKGCLTVACVLAFETLGQSIWSFVLDISTESDSLSETGGSPFALAGLLLSVPLTSYYRFLSYINERTELDGWDIQIAFLALANRAREGLAKEAA